MWDHLGRLTQVKNAGGTVLATYTYDPLDRLRLIDYGAGVRIRFRYVGLTTAVAQWLDDAAGTVTRSVGTGWSGERLLDWTGSGSNIRVYGENGHHDMTWLASSTGTVSQSLRYDPWGNPRSTPPSGYSPFRFQGSYLDDLRDTDSSNDLAWVISRWYAPTLGRFASEDSLLGEPIDPPSRHLYAYGQGEPVGRWDPDGRLPFATTYYRFTRRSGGGRSFRTRLIKYSIGPALATLGRVQVSWDALGMIKGKPGRQYRTLTTWNFLKIDAVVSSTMRISAASVVTFKSGRRLVDYSFHDVNRGVTYNKCSLCAGRTRAFGMSTGEVKQVEMTLGVYFTLHGAEESVVPALGSVRVIFRKPPPVHR